MHLLRPDLLLRSDVLLDQSQDQEGGCADRSREGAVLHIPILVPQVNVRRRVSYERADEQNRHSREKRDGLISSKCVNEGYA